MDQVKFSITQITTMDYTHSWDGDIVRDYTKERYRPGAGVAKFSCKEDLESVVDKDIDDIVVENFLIHNMRFTDGPDYENASFIAEIKVLPTTRIGFRQ